MPTDTELRDQASDDLKQTSVPTYPSDGGGLGHEIGLYRGPSYTGTDTLYVDSVFAGPTRASVGS